MSRYACALERHVQKRQKHCAMHINSFELHTYIIGRKAQASIRQLPGGGKSRGPCGGSTAPQISCIVFRRLNCPDWMDCLARMCTGVAAMSTKLSAVEVVNCIRCSTSWCVSARGVSSTVTSGASAGGVTDSSIDCFLTFTIRGASLYSSPPYCASHVARVLCSFLIVFVQSS
ncbi:hypothetical protein T492DRAFT_956405 [Pavlovales sp. CCMP2436]|nr:hypothetical protein T492DRAFT_956405 [Pavlovales sp. CCMP2436]